MNQALIYNPITKGFQSYDETNTMSIDLCIENFIEDTKYFFQKSSKFNYSFAELKNLSNVSSTLKADYIRYVETMKLEIESGRLIKGVAAQRQVLSIMDGKLDFERIFHSLVERYPAAFVYLFHLRGDIWLGASPEVIGVLNDGQFRTISLAGTRVLDSKEFSEKEIKEQSIVTQIITKQIAVDAEPLIEKVTSLNFGSIQHLVNELTISVGENFDFKGLIHEIHPSPALVGYPKEIAKDFVYKNEMFDRQFYCGLVHMKESLEEQYAFATIRCAHLTKNQIIFYAGAGITSESDSESEWNETLNKIETIQSVLF